jgi:hypothetical protein
MIARGYAYASGEGDGKSGGCPRLRAMQPFEDRNVSRCGKRASGRAALGPDAAVALEASNGAGDALRLFCAPGAHLQVSLNNGGICAEKKVGELFVCEVVGEVAFH